VYLNCLYEPRVLSSPIHINICPQVFSFQSRTQKHADINTRDFNLLGHLKNLAYSAQNEKTPRELNVPIRKQTTLFVQLRQVISSYLLPLFDTNFTRTLSRIESVSCYEFVTYKPNQTHFSTVITNTWRWPCHFSFSAVYRANCELI